jgi:hypothetical protein
VFAHVVGGGRGGESGADLRRRRTFAYLAREKGGSMPRHKSLITVIRETVQNEVRAAVQGLLGGFGGQPKAKATNGRRKRRRGTWRPGGPGRPPKAVAVKAVSRTAKKAARKKQ